MKHFNLKCLLLLCCLATVYFTSCTPRCEECCNAQDKCGPHGTCLDGACTCEDGYETQVCDTLSSTKFLGRWKAKETHQYNGVTDTIKIDWTAQTTSPVSRLKITNGNGSVNTLSIYGNKLTVKNEIVLDSLHIITSGSATINKTKDKMDYSFFYKAVNNIPAFQGSGVLIKQ